MSPRTLVYIFSAIATCLAMESWSQRADSVRRDSTLSRYRPTGVRIGFDVMTFGKSQFMDEFDGWEVAADIDFHRYFLVFEYGASALTEPLRNGVYANDGTYYRVGIDVNFLHKDPVKNMFFLGGRFGHSSYADQASYITNTLQFDSSAIFIENRKVIGTWVELTSGLKVRLWKFFWLGGTVRFKFGLDLDGNIHLRSYEVPGFGRNINPTWWGFNYYVLFRMPFKPESRKR